ncbi:MAG: hypothetical protein JNL32_03600 [Candidatus Kapabacteria bacterium]|nr:hypothetical protein [Candidatus Kapabacteria bacterium]
MDEEDKIGNTLQDVWADDKLNRQTIADILTLRVENAEKPMTIAIDGDFGVGKTFFVQRLQKYLMALNYHCVLYNSWESDYLDNPLLSIISTITNQLQQQLTSNRQAYKKIASGIKKLAPMIVRGTAAFVTMGQSEHAVKAAETIGGELAQILKKHSAEQKSFDAFRQALSDYITTEYNEKHKLIVIVDELDRCKPTFALQTLEIIKHLFDVPGVVFILSTNMNQLQHTVRAVYGDSVNGHAYLNRFIDQHIILPNDVEFDYITTLIDTYGGLPEEISTRVYRPIRVEFEIFVRHIIESNKIPTRNVHKIFKLFRKYVEDARFSFTPVNSAVLFYFTFLQFHDYELYYELLTATGYTDETFNRVYKNLNAYAYESGVLFYLDTMHLPSQRIREIINKNEELSFRGVYKLSDYISEFTEHFYQKEHPGMRLKYLLQGMTATAPHLIQYT